MDTADGVIATIDDLTYDEHAAVVTALRQAIDQDRYPLLPRMERFKTVLTCNAMRPRTVRLESVLASCHGVSCLLSARPPMKLKTFVIAAGLAVSVSGAAIAQYACPAGYVYAGGACVVPTAPGGYSNPASGAASGTAAGATSGYNAAGPVGGALGTATGAVGGAANTVTGVTGAVTGTSRCAYGYYLASATRTDKRTLWRLIGGAAGSRLSTA